eukprot:m.184723 g.184723  ORF g.184723 m.184723 type:complete len:403 (+) comp15393_c10_seq4:44-1252(+)
MSWENKLEGGAVPDSYIDPPFEFDAPRWDPLEPGSKESTSDDAWFAMKHPLHEGPRNPAKALLPLDVIAQCAEQRKLKQPRTSASVTPVAPSEPPGGREGANFSGHTPLKITGRAQRVSSSNSPFNNINTPGSLRRRAAPRASSGLALCSMRPLQFHSPSENTEEKEKSGSSNRGGSGAKRANRNSAHEDEEDAIARLLAAHNSKVREHEQDCEDGEQEAATDEHTQRRREKEESKLPLRAVQTNLPEPRLRRPDVKSAFLFRSEHTASTAATRVAPALAPAPVDHTRVDPAPRADLLREAASRGPENSALTTAKRATTLLAGPARRRRTEDHSKALGFRREADDDDDLDDLKSLLEQHNRNVVAQQSNYDQNGRRRVVPATTAAPKPLGRADPLRASAVRR